MYKNVSLLLLQIQSFAPELIILEILLQNQLISKKIIPIYKPRGYRNIGRPITRWDDAFSRSTYNLHAEGESDQLNLYFLKHSQYENVPNKRYG